MVTLPDPGYPRVMAKVTVASCAFVHPNDVNTGKQDANKLAGVLDKCVGRATLALQQPLPKYSDFYREQLALKFRWVCQPGLAPL